MGYIYKITNNINNKVYIGMTRYTVQKRWQEHKKDCQKKDTHLYFAMRKYGIENFSIEVIEECKEEDLILREAYWIQFYNSYNNEYNMTEGKGEGNGTSFNARPIEQYDLKGNFIARYKSVGEASSITKIQSANIQRAAHQRCNSAGNFQWKFVDDNRIIGAIKEHEGGGKGISILQYDENWNLINTFPSSRQAAKSIGYKGALPAQWLKDNKIHYGYYWKKDIQV